MRLPQAIAWALSLWPSPPIEPTRPTNLDTLNLTLRHVHAHKGARVVFKDVSDQHRFFIQQQPAEEDGRRIETSYQITPRLVKTHKPRSQAQFFEAREASLKKLRQRRRGFPLAVSPNQKDEDEIVVAWDEWDVPGPNTDSRETLQVLAKMTWNAYITPDDGSWYDLGDDWGQNYPFGWEPDSDGFRGHVFASADNSTVVISIKGTSIVGGGGPTVVKDKLNDNLLFSCCCARVGPTWSTVCGCYQGRSRCDEDCVQQSLVDDSLFYPIGTNLYNNLTYMYPDANIWVTGHSLGGSLAALMGVTFGTPTVAFEAPGDRMPSKRLHLPKPPSLQHVTHVFHTADPIPMGTCTGVLSSCAIAGYAMESRCHQGKKRLYDTVTRYGWSQDVRTHRIGVIIDRLLTEDWEEGVPVPLETEDGDDCDAQECYSWQYESPTNTTSLQ